MGCGIESATKKFVQNLHFLLVHKISHLSFQIKIWGIEAWRSPDLGSGDRVKFSLQDYKRKGERMVTFSNITSATATSCRYLFVYCYLFHHVMINS